jgi:hypothetical protein
LARALGNNSPLIQWKEEEWWRGKEGGKYRKEEKNVYGFLSIYSFYTKGANST